MASEFDERFEAKRRGIEERERPLWARYGPNGRPVLEAHGAEVPRPQLRGTSARSEDPVTSHGRDNTMRAKREGVG